MEYLDTNKVHEQGLAALNHFCRTQPEAEMPQRVKPNEVKCIYKAHLKTTHVDKCCTINSQ